MKGVIGSDSIAIKLDGDQSEVKDRLNQLRRELETEFDISETRILFGKKQGTNLFVK